VAGAAGPRTLERGGVPLADVARPPRVVSCSDSVFFLLSCGLFRCNSTAREGSYMVVAFLV
jgi:hypothetical protein